MAKKRSAGMISKLIKVAMIIPAILSVTKGLIFQGRQELIGMRKRLIAFCIAALFSLILLLTTWWCLLAMLITYLLSQAVSMMVTLLIVFMLNCFMLIIFGIYLSTIKLDPSFPETRKVIRELISS